MPPPEAGSIKGILHVAGILALIVGIIALIVGVVTVIFIVGIIPIVIGVINILIYTKTKEISRLIDEGRYREAKNMTLTWMIIGFILGMR